MAIFNFRKKRFVNLFSSQSATWLDLSKKESLLQIFYSIPEVAAPILWKANAFSNMNVGLKNIKTNKEIKYFQADKFEKHLIDLFVNPNCLQAKTEFFKQFFVNLDVFGDAFIYGLKSDTKPFKPENIAALWNLPSMFTGIETTGKMFMQSKKADIIQRYILKYNGKETLFDNVQEVFHKNHVNIKYGNNEEVKGESKLVNLHKPLSNLIATYDARNVLITKRGAIGALTGDAGKDGVGLQLPLDPRERSRIQDEYQKYGLSKDQYQILITDYPMKWIPFVFDMNQLKLHEETELDFQEILSVYGIKREVFPNTKGGTFSNVREAEKASYQNVIIPEFEDTLREINNWLGLRDMGYEYYPQYDHIPILQVDRMIFAQAQQITNSVYQVLWDIGAITKNQWLMALGMPEVDEPSFNERNPNPTSSTIPNTVSLPS